MTRERTEDMTEDVERAAVWKRVVATILDFITVFMLGGMIIAKLTGNTTDEGFNLNGTPAVMLFAFVAIYFFIGRRFAGGTLWDRIFRIRRPQPE
jgi:uncharacterized membrane protein YoaK (UPF0700 family)